MSSSRQLAFNNDFTTSRIGIITDDDDADDDDVTLLTFIIFILAFTTFANNAEQSPVAYIVVVQSMYS